MYFAEYLVDELWDVMRSYVEKLLKPGYQPTYPLERIDQKIAIAAYEIALESVSKDDAANEEDE